MITKSDFIVPLPKDKKFKKKVLDYALSENLGVEIQAFVNQNDFSKKSQIIEKLKEYKKSLDNFPNFYSIHGPIYEIKPHTVDREIFKIVKKRVEDTLSISQKIGCKRVIFHTGWNPLITPKREKEYILMKQVEFWSDILEQYSDITLCLENMWDFTPVFLKLLTDKVDNDRLGICLDVGHLNVYSKTDIDIWFDELKDKVKHLHLHDNRSKVDEHLAIGKGNLNWKKIFNKINNLEKNPKIVLEIDTEKKFYSSMKYLKKNNFIKS